MRIYIAGPLFNDMERERNERFCRTLESHGHWCYLPQRDSGEFAAGNLNRQEIFDRDLQGLADADTLIFLSDGRVPDEGACFELGYAYAKGLRTYEYKSDVRTFIDGFPNIMLQYGVRQTFTRMNDLLEVLEHAD